MERSLVGVDGVGHLIVAGFVERSQVEPDFGEVRVNSNRSRVGVEGVVELIDVVVQDSDRTPECWILSVSVDCLLIRFVRFAEIARRHVRSTKQVPREGIVGVFRNVSSARLLVRRDVRRTGFETLRQNCDRHSRIVEGSSRTMIQSTELL